MKLTIVEVSDCDGCPFLHRSTGGLACMAKGMGHDRPVKATWPAPRWCPLRKQDHLVTLRTP